MLTMDIMNTADIPRSKELLGVNDLTISQWLEQHNFSVGIPGDSEYASKSVEQLDSLGQTLFEGLDIQGELESATKAISIFSVALSKSLAEDNLIPSRLHYYAIALLKRYQYLEDHQDVQQALSALQLALRSTPANHPLLPRRTSDLGRAYRFHFEITQDQSDIQHAISLLRKAVDLARPNEDLPQLHINLGDALQTLFHKSHDMSILHEAISTQKKALDLTPNGHPKLPGWLNNLAGSLESLSEQTSRLEDITEAIEVQQKAIAATADGHPDLPGRYNNLGNLILRRHWISGELDDIANSISAHEKAVKFSGDKHPNLPGRLNNLGTSYQFFYRRTGDVKYLDHAISFQQRAIDITPEGHKDLPTRLNNLASSLQFRFEDAGDLNDITESILVRKRAIDATPISDMNAATMLTNLGSSYERRFEATGDLDDLREAVATKGRALEIVPETNPNYASFLTNLGNALQVRFEYTGQLEDIERAIACQKRALELIADDHAKRASFLNNLSTSYQYRFESTGDISNLSESISIQEKAVELVQEGHVDTPRLLNNLGNVYQSRFELLGDLADIDKAISLQERATALTPDTHTAQPQFLINLGNAYQSRFQRTGVLTDISEAISAQQKALHLADQRGNANQLPVWLSNIGNTFYCRFLNTSDLSDILESIAAHETAIKALPDDHAAKPGILDRLGTAYRSCFHLTKDVADISAAITNQEQALNLLSESSPALLYTLNNLGNSYSSRFVITKDVDDINKAIAFQERAVDLASDENAITSTLCNNLGNSYREKCFYFPTSDDKDILRAIALQEKAVSLTPEGHAEGARQMINLGASYSVHYRISQDASSVQKALSLFRKSALSSAGSPSHRLEASLKWMKLAQEHDRSQCTEAGDTAIRLLSEVSGMARTIERRHEKLGEMSQFATSAAAVAISLGNMAKALEWLEQGRCLVWNQLNQLRTPVDDLRAHDPSLADRVVEISRALETAGSRTDLTDDTETDVGFDRKISLQDEVSAHVKLADEWDRLLAEIRQIPDFRDFLRPPSSASILSSLPDSGFVVVVNVDAERCDALVLHHGSQLPIHIPLPGFSHKRAFEMHQLLSRFLAARGVRLRDASIGDDLEGDEGEEDEEEAGEVRAVRRANIQGRQRSVLEGVLRELWISVAQPILTGIGISHPIHPLPRIWWCTTGPLAFLPIHAAGSYHSDKVEHGAHLSDFAVSSYTPTVTSLLNKVQYPTPSNPESTGVLMISQPNTPGMSPIPATTEEVKNVGQLLSSNQIKNLCLENDQATIHSVSEEIQNFSFIHMACHAVQDKINPLESGFHLHDGRLELLVIIRRRLPNAHLAFLSACQTSAGDEILSEEAVHLAAGMLTAGYRGVVATMWSIKDTFAPKVAGEFYKNLIDFGKDAEESSGDKLRLRGEFGAYALHRAIEVLRRERNDTEQFLLTWVPYIHIGI